MPQTNGVITVVTAVVMYSLAAPSGLPRIRSLFACFLPSRGMVAVASAVAISHQPVQEPAPTALSALGPTKRCQAFAGPRRPHTALCVSQL